MVLTIVYPSVLVAANISCLFNGYVSIVQELTATCSVKPLSGNGAIVNNSSQSVFNTNGSGNSYCSHIVQQAITVGRQAVGLYRAMVVDVQTIVQMQHTGGYNLCMGCHVNHGVGLQIGSICSAQRQCGTLKQIEF